MTHAGERKRISLHRGLRGRALCVGIALIAFTVIGTASISLLQQYEKSISENRLAAARFASGVATGAELAFAVGDHDELQRLADAAISEDGVDFIAFRDDAGELVASAQVNDQAWQRYIAGSTEQGVCIGSSDVISRSGGDLGLGLGDELSFEFSDEPVSLEATNAEGESFGSITIALSNDRVYESIRAQIIAGLSFAIGITVLGSAALLLLLRLPLGRLERLAQSSRALTEGDFEHAIDARGSDEIAELAAALENMRLAVRARTEELRQLNSSLQERVDIRTSELRQALLAAEAASRAKSDFLANMSHEIRTPMTAILGYTELLSDSSTLDDPKRRREAIEVVQRNGHHLLSIINDILDLSKIEAGKMEIEVGPMSLVEVAREATELLRERAESSGLKLALEFKTDIARRIHSDSTRVKQILINLIGNAVKFTQEGSVRVEIEQDGDRFAASVIDTGIGISAEQQGRLFQAFQQADNSMSRRYGGTGLGLALSQRLAHLMGGGITICSEQNVGSTFRFTFCAEVEADAGTISAEQAEEPKPVLSPALVNAPAPSPSALQQPDSSGSSVTGSRVLLVEDGLDNQRLISHLLTKLGVDVDVAENGLVGIERVEAANAARAPYAMVFMDMQMPELDGYSATSRLRADGCQLPIVALTAHAMAGDRERCLDAGCDDYSTKPVNKRTLADLMEKWIGQRSKRAA